MTRIVISSDIATLCLLYILSCSQPVLAQSDDAQLLWAAGHNGSAQSDESGGSAISGAGGTGVGGLQVPHARAWGRRGPVGSVMCSATYSLHAELIPQLAAAGIFWCGGTQTMEGASASPCRWGA